jgi:uncharacterized membrane protein
MMHLLRAVEKSRTQGFLGALHPGTVHFPIALLAVAALLEVLQIVRKRKELAPGTVALSLLAALTAIPAVFFGFQLQEYESVEGSLVELHKWLGLGAAFFALASAILASRVKTKPALVLPLRGTLILGSLLVLATGYYGGEMQSGEGHLIKFLFPKAQAKGSDGTGSDPKPSDPPASGGAMVDFVKDIAPIIKDSCLKCHGGEKTKGKLRLNTKAEAMKGGESGKCINPGKPTLSSFYTLLIDPDPDVRMPEKAKPLKPALIELVKKWIEQGADWPEGYEVKP